MNRILTLLLVALSLVAPSYAEDSPAPKNDESFFTTLRMEYARRKDFSPGWKLDKEREAVVGAYREKEYQKAFDLGERWLGKCPVDSDIHILCASAADSLGDIKSYMHHFYFAFGLMESITHSGDGRTKETAFKVISVSEEYSVLREFSAEVQGQALTDGFIDEMKCKFPNGKIENVYFDASIPIKSFKLPDK